MSEYIRGQVAGIRTRTEVILTLDKLEKTHEGMVFIVYEEGETIEDSKGHPFGQLELQKARVRITHVQPGFAAAESAEVVRIWRGPEPSPDDVDQSLYEQYLEEGELYETIMKPIAEIPGTQSSGKEQTGKVVVMEPPTIRELARSRLKNRRVVEGDLVRSEVPVG